MFCGNCGSEIQEGLKICSNCSKSPYDVNIKIGEYPLINMSAKLYTLFFEIGLWLLLIIGTVVGGLIGNLLSREGQGIFSGMIIGFFLAFVIMIQIGGFISIFLKLNRNIEKIEKSVKNK